MNCYSIQFLSLISLVVLLAPLYVSGAVPSPVSKADCLMDGVMIHLLGVFLCESSNLKMLFATKTSCLVSFFTRKKLNLELESSFSEIASLRSAHDDMSAKPCDRYTMIMVSHANLWLIHSHVAALLDSARLEFKELKAHFTLLGACTSCSVLRSDLEAAGVEIKDLNHKLDHFSRYTVLSSPCEACIFLKDKLLYAIKENTELQ
jgi:hypothetical protein